MENKKVVCCFLRKLSAAVPLESSSGGGIGSIQLGGGLTKGLYVTKLYFKVTFPNELLESKNLETDNADFTVAVVAEYNTSTDKLIEMARADLDKMFNQQLVVVHETVPFLFAD